MQTSPSGIYQQNIDKQRILVLGKNRSRIVQLTLFVLKFNHKKYSCYTPKTVQQEDAPFIIIEPEETNDLLEGYQHHVLVLSGLSVNEKTICSKLADLTPKSGAIIYDEKDPVSSEIAKIQRTDVSTHPYTVLKHELKQGKAVLISSSNEKIETGFATTEDLKNMSAVKELVKKIGISSGQFYRAMTAFQ
ncbi:MAG: hypothetical protein JST43_01785 [Bacteroidetes bacterium]|nr:hypothetical protein [Bacteroidota bacterium]MBS1541952.1 hypothetical protein [Bacteroidota bacterium]